MPLRDNAVKNFDTKKVFVIPSDRANLRNFDDRPVSDKVEIIKQISTGHSFCKVNRNRVKGQCVTCIKRNYVPNQKPDLKKIDTYCPTCQGGNWICEPCFDAEHGLEN